MKIVEYPDVSVLELRFGTRDFYLKMCLYFQVHDGLETAQ